MRIPPGFNTVTPYFFVDGAAGFLDFLVRGLGGVEIGRHMDGERIANAQVRLGTSTVMVSEGSPAFPAMPASYYLYVDDADEAMDKALAAGATKIMDVADMPYLDGMRQCWWSNPARRHFSRSRPMANTWPASVTARQRWRTRDCCPCRRVRGELNELRAARVLRFRPRHFYRQCRRAQQMPFTSRPPFRVQPGTVGAPSRCATSRNSSPHVPATPGRRCALRPIHPRARGPRASPPLPSRRDCAR